MHCPDWSGEQEMQAETGQGGQHPLAAVKQRTRLGHRQIGGVLALGIGAIGIVVAFAAALSVSFPVVVLSGGRALDCGTIVRPTLIRSLCDTPVADRRSRVIILAVVAMILVALAIIYFAAARVSPPKRVITFVASATLLAVAVVGIRMVFDHYSRLPLGDSGWQEALPNHSLHWFAYYGGYVPAFLGVVGLIGSLLHRTDGPARKWPAHQWER